jgi:hypothetical protein
LAGRYLLPKPVPFLAVRNGSPALPDEALRRAAFAKASGGLPQSGPSKL